jgi:hypothetical protein
MFWLQTWLGARGNEFRLLIGKVAQLLVPLTDLAVLFQQPVHGTRRANVEALVQQRGVDLVRGWIHEALRAQVRQRGLPLAFGKGLGRYGPFRSGRGFGSGCQGAVEGSPRDFQSTAGCRAAVRRGKFQGRGHELL